MYPDKIAIIILNYNSSSDCKKCVSFLRQQINIDMEIILVDNCSQAEDLQIVEDICLSESLTLIKSETNRGYSAGNNIGLRYASSKGYEYALILNPDMELHQTDYISRLADCISNDPSIAVAGSDIITHTGVHQNPMREILFWEEFLWPLDFLRKQIKGSYSSMQDHSLSGYYEKLSGCCFMIRTSFLDEIGFLDENTFLYCEEPILAKQVQRAGLKMFYLADLQAIHMHIKSTKGNPAKRMSLFFESRKYYLKHYSGYSGIQLQLVLISRKIQEKLFNVYFSINSNRK